jgi:hypothetical protein
MKAKYRLGMMASQYTGGASGAEGNRKVRLF